MEKREEREERCLQELLFVLYEKIMENPLFSHISEEKTNSDKNWKIEISKYNTSSGRRLGRVV